MSHASLSDLCFSVVVTDPRQKDSPIVYASDDFLRLTGYNSEEVIGRNCRFLQGVATERRHITEIRDAIREERSCKVCLANYKKSGELFWNQLYIEPIFDSSGIVMKHIGIQTDVTHLYNEMHPTAAEELQRVVESEKKNAKEVSLRLARNSRVMEQDVCSVLPSSIVVALERIQQSFVLVDPTLPGMPVVHAGESFIKLTGYPKDQIIGRNCRFLQGPKTDVAEVNKIREAIHANPPRSVTVTLLNYKFDGTPFWNALHIAPVRNADGRVVYLVGVQLNADEQDQTDVEPLDQISLPNVTARLCRRGRRIPFCPGIGLQQTILQSGTVGEVRVAIRSLCGCQGGLRRSIESSAESQLPYQQCPPKE